MKKNKHGMADSHGLILYNSANDKSRIVRNWVALTMVEIKKDFNKDKQLERESQNIFG